MGETGQMVLQIGMLVALGVLGVIYGTMRRNKNSGASGKGQASGSGKDKALGVVRSFARQNSFRLVAPATVVCGEKTAVLDAVVVGYFGVLGVIVLGYGGEIYGDAKEKTWLQVTGAGERNSFANPVMESTAAVRVLREVLMKAGQKKVPVDVVYVFSDPAAKLLLPRSLAPMRVADLKKMLKKDKYLDDCGLDMDAAAAAIQQAVQE